MKKYISLVCLAFALSSCSKTEHVPSGPHKFQAGDMVETRLGHDRGLVVRYTGWPADNVIVRFKRDNFADYRYTDQEMYEVELVKVEDNNPKQ